jgi:hypothetical protein
MHVIVRERDTDSPAVGTQVEATNAHKVLINTSQRTMDVTEVDGGALLVRASDLLGHPVPVRNELQGTDPLAMTQEERTGAKEDLPPEERMLRVGIQGILSSHMPNGSDRDALLDRLFQYTRKFRPNTLEVTEDMVEYAARAAFQRHDAYRGAHWARAGVGITPTTEATREEFRRNARAALEAAQDFTRLEADAPEPKDPAKRGWFGLGPEVERTKDDYALTEPVAEPQWAETANDRPALKFGQFWDTMAGLLIDGMQHLVVFRADGNVYAAIAGRGADGVTPLWLAAVSEHNVRAAGTKMDGVPLYHLSHLSSFTILGTYQHAQDVPF